MPAGYRAEARRAEHDIVLRRQSWHRRILESGRLRIWVLDPHGGRPGFSKGEARRQVVLDRPGQLRTLIIAQSRRHAKKTEIARSLALGWAVAPHYYALAAPPSV
jgi:hypothetical protein